MNSTTTATRRGALGLLAASGFGLTACGANSKASDASDPAGSAAAPAASKAPEADSASDGGGARDSSASDGGGAGTTAGTPSSTGADPIATAEVPITRPGDPDATMTVSLLALTRSGDTLEATYEYTLHATTDGDSGRIDSLHEFNGATKFRPFLIDQKNLNKHLAIDEVSTESTELVLNPEKPKRGQWVFGAPPADVTAMDVVLWTGEPLVKQVPIR